MDKATSIVAAFEAGKLPSTQQFTHFIDFANSIVTQVEPRSLTSKGRVLGEDVKNILKAYKLLAMNKNGDNILQEAIWHLEQGDIVGTTTQSLETESALADVNALRSSIRTLVNVLWGSTRQEGLFLTYDFFSFLRMALANAAEVFEQQAARAKSSLRDVENQVQKGDRDYLGRDKKALEERNRSLKSQFEQGMDSFKRFGATVIEAGEEATTSLEEATNKTTSKLQDVFFKICDQAQSQDAYQQAVKTIVNILQARLSQSLQAIQHPDQLTTATFLNDPTVEQHIPKAVDAILEFLDRFTPMSPILNSFRKCLLSVINDRSLSSFFKSAFDHLLKDLTQQGFVRSEESKREWKDLKLRWEDLTEKDSRWKAEVDDFYSDVKQFTDSVESDEDLIRLREAHVKLGRDIERGLVEPGIQEGGLQSAIEGVTWFYQDLLRVYVPKLLSLLKDIPIPRTEYVDPDIEFVLENLDISSFNLLPSHIYIRNITDIDFKSAPDSPSRTDVGTLTHIKMQALQFRLNDVSFYYKDKNGSAFAPAEYTGLIAVTLPPEGVSIEAKIRLIPLAQMKQREEAQRYTILEHISVDISPGIEIEVKNSNHSLLLSVFRPIMVQRLREALERTLTEQIRWLIGWIDGMIWDMNRRREVFADAGAGMWFSIVGAVMSEVGRMRRAGSDRKRVSWTATASGIIIEQTPAPGTIGTPSRAPVARIAMGAEPQILSGEKHGPLGTASSSLNDRLQNALGNAADMAVDAGVIAERSDQGGVEVEAMDIRQQTHAAIEQGRRQVQSFKESVGAKAKRERSRQGWRSGAFDF